MKTFDRQIGFNKTWRTYQRRVLDELTSHLDDDHLHIVAAPGSGKTVLGLEVVRRLGKPAIIFSPTLTIRDQWGDRFVSLFCGEGVDGRSMISKDLSCPGLLTLTTYQGLHSAYHGGSSDYEEGEEEIEYEVGNNNSATDRNCQQQLIQTLVDIGVETIVVDEAHHLRNEWWKCLLDLKSRLKNPVVVALTATPPVDVNPLEWERYQRLCGPIDSEISVPELVKEKNLCPHQDYVYFSLPKKNEKRAIQSFRADVKDVYRQVCECRSFADALKEHPYANDPDQYIDEILADPAFFSSIIVFIWHIQKQFPRKLMKVLGVSGKKIPKLNYEWMEILLTGCLYRHAESFNDEVILPEDIVQRLKRTGAIERRMVQLRSTSAIKKLLSSSLSKLDSIQQITALEHESLADSLRMVILTDYIRKADLPKGPDDLKPIQRMGVVPIFETLRRSDIPVKTGVMCGSLIMVPTESAEMFKSILDELSIDRDRVRMEPLECDGRYLVIDGIGLTRSRLVRAVTCLFNRGGLEVLVGTKSLLGEGWDAPSINSLILASFVGSHMLSNQMRGRAIRTQEGNPKKTANIWHLVCVEEDSDCQSDDYVMLSRRFKSYVGVSFTEVAIQNGLGRLGIKKPPFSKRNVRSINEKMIGFALNRDGMRQRWLDAFAAGETAQMIEELQSPPEFVPRNLIITKTIKMLLLDGLFWAGQVFSMFRFQSGDRVDGKSAELFFCVAFGLAGLVLLPFCLKALYLFLKNGPIVICLQQIGRALLESLIHTGEIQTELKKMGVKIERLEGGAVSCSLSGATTFEKKIFLDAMQEILDPIDNPRYVLVRMSYFCGLLRKDYHAVPKLLGNRKDNAIFFAARWKKYLGASHLIYTRSVEGRSILIRARGASLSGQFQKRSERRRVWK